MAESVFLCHSSGDKEHVRDLYRRLRRDGFEPWLDEEDILPGQDWDAEIRRAIQQSRYVLVCLSKGSVTKRGYVQKEIKHALDVADEQPEGSIFLIPSRLEVCRVPDRLRSRHWVDLFAADGYERLLLALGRARHGGDAHGGDAYGGDAYGGIAGVGAASRPLGIATGAAAAFPGANQVPVTDPPPVRVPPVRVPSASRAAGRGASGSAEGGARHAGRRTDVALVAWTVPAFTVTALHFAGFRWAGIATPVAIGPFAAFVLLGFKPTWPTRRVVATGVSGAFLGVPLVFFLIRGTQSSAIFGDALVVLGEALVAAAFIVSCHVGWGGAPPRRTPRE